MARPDPHPVRSIVVALVVGGLFSIGMYVYLRRATQPSSTPPPVSSAEGAAAAKPAGPSALETAASVAGPFVAHLAAGRFAEAHQLLAAPFRAAVPVAAFEKTCRASPILAGARSVALNHMRQQNAGGGSFSLEASGVLETAAGAVPVGFVFLREAGALRILVVSVAGVPVLQGVTPG